MLDRRVHPVIPEKGSVARPKEISPRSAHLALSMIGEEGDPGSERATSGGRRGFACCRDFSVRLRAKEGLALLNGTQAMCGVGGLALYRGREVTALADLAGAMSLEACAGRLYRLTTNRVRRDRILAKRLRQHTYEICSTDSEIRRSHLTNEPRVQDAYSLRCMPQVHGAVRTALQHAREVTEIESGSATDNPLVFADTGDVLSGGNFHGAPLGMVYDYAALALADLMSISERRIDRLVNPDLNEGLPPFLSSHPGISSGYMIAQVCAASLLNEARILAHPASVDNVPTSGGKEDHVSMGMTSALKLRQITWNAERVIAIELLAAAEGLDYRAPLRSSRRIEQAREMIRSLSSGD